MKTFKTKAGTELPLMDIKGKDYLQAAPRIFWMKEEHPGWSIETEFITLNETIAICKATIRDESNRILSTATSAETPKGFEAYIEKAETCAISRAASFCGYGTLMAQELEVDNNPKNKISDSPIQPKAKSPLVKPAQSSTFGDYVIPMGKDKGKKLKELTRDEILEKMEAIKNLPEHSKEVLEIYDAMEAYSELNFFPKK